MSRTLISLLVAINAAASGTAQCIHGDITAAAIGCAAVSAGLAAYGSALSFKKISTSHRSARLG